MKTFHSGAFGASGSGKTTVLRALLADQKRVVFLDPMEEAASWRGWRQVQTVAQVKAAIHKSPLAFRVCIAPPPDREAEILDDLAALMMAVQAPYKRGRGGARAVLAVDEMNNAFPVNSGTARAPHFAKMCSTGRHFGLDLYGASQGVSEVDTRFRRNLARVFIGRQKGQADKTAAAQLLDVPVARVAALTNYHFIAEENGAVIDVRTTAAGKIVPT